MKTLFTLVFITISTLGFSQKELKSFQIFNQEGKKVSYEKMIEQLAKNQVILFGELHNNSMAHWFELQVTKSIFAIDPKLTLGAEMFEADAQLILSEYLNGKIKSEHLESEGKVWKNYKTDYAPLVNFAKDNQLAFIATNIPRRYANLVFREGLEGLTTLDAQSKNYIAPQPIKVDLELPGYKSMMESMGGHMAGASVENLAKSQASKDATMAWFINKNLNNHFIHYNGSYHSNNFDGIFWHLKNYNSSITIGSINVVEQENVNDLEEQYLKSASFIIVVPSDMTKTY